MAETFWVNEDYQFRQYDGGTSDGPDHDESLVAAAAKGALAGLLGTVVISLGMTYGPRLMEKYGLMDGGSEPPDDPAEPQEPTEVLVDKVASTVFDADMPAGPRHLAGRAVHWSYGASRGALYGVSQSQLKLPPALGGLVLGAIASGVASTVVPALDLAPPPTEQPLPQTAMMSALHILYGETVALAYEAL